MLGVPATLLHPTPPCPCHGERDWRCSSTFLCLCSSCVVLSVMRRSSVLSVGALFVQDGLSVAIAEVLPYAAIVFLQVRSGTILIPLCVDHHSIAH